MFDGCQNLWDLIVFVYSEKIVKFIQEITAIIKDVLTKELHLTVSGNRFLDSKKRYSYPLSVVIYNDENMLGYFNPEFFQLGFHERLMYVNKTDLRNIIRHELAHYMTFINNPYVKTPHGFEFRAFCKQVGWGEEVYSATLHLTDEISDVEESDILRKIKKLMALSSSSNKNEAEQAMIKSQELLLKHNIETKHLESSDEEKIFLKRIMKQPKKTAKMTAIAKILEVFFVSVVFSRTLEGTYLEILGNKINLQIAQYVADVLNQKLDDLWNQIKHEHKLKGLTAKNSFFLGIAIGYCNKIKALKTAYPAAITQSLIIVEKNLEKAKALVYKRLLHSTGTSRYCETASSLGKQAGTSLNINPAIQNTCNHSNELITHKKLD